MHITITYNDTESFTKEEVVRQAIHNYGKSANVDVMPDSTNAHDFIYFGIQQIITHEQLSLLFEKNSTYNTNIKKLREEILYKITEILDSVIIDNEDKVAK
jgi:hypothetical protein